MDRNGHEKTSRKKLHKTVRNLEKKMATLVERAANAASCIAGLAFKACRKMFIQNIESFRSLHGKNCKFSL